MEQEIVEELGAEAVGQGEKAEHQGDVNIEEEEGEKIRNPFASASGPLRSGRR